MTSTHTSISIDRVDVNARASQITDLDVRIAALLANVGVRAEAASISTCRHGGNNRIHKVETTDGLFAVKEYFRHADDPRDRLASETMFLEYANAASPGATPRLFGSDPAAGLVLLEFIDGTSIRVGQVDWLHVDAAISFFRDLNAPEMQAAARLPAASEASFSIADHLAIIEARVRRLLAVEPRSDLDVAALVVIRQLSSIWDRVGGGIRDMANRERLDVGCAISQRCISPSDFGFHNALVTTDGRVRFVDFEYAGWDDPAKTVGDFFAQPSVPVPNEYFDRFVQHCMDQLPDPELATRRATLLRPAYQVKWCCIALNVFVPVHLARRRFANPTLDEDAFKRSQIVIAERFLDEIQRGAR